ncbi:hypothetical protein SLOPH_2186 [Spraguea lophii 42_110]|uniref:Uncharacterized protein n=1 Tax=Spraguea lophii (strain 42_110) TaxID=1358809 RepID=S7W4U6_SPRLO|nr:hypothetical protein SLOPH_2186 [Spraguea lophii 42_110]
MHKQPIYISSVNDYEYFIFSLLPTAYSFISIIFNDFKENNISINIIISTLILLGSMISFALKSDLFIIFLNFASILKFLVNIVWDNAYYDIFNIGLMTCKKQVIINTSPIILVLFTDILMASFCTRNTALFLKFLSSIALLLYFCVKKDFLYDVRYIFPLLTIPALVFFYFITDDFVKRLNISFCLITLTVITTMLIINCLDKQKFYQIACKYVTIKNMGYEAVIKILNYIGMSRPIKAIKGIWAYLWRKVTALKTIKLVY